MSTYQRGVDMFMRTLDTKFGVNITGKSPKWSTIETKVVQIVKEHRANMNKEDKETGTGDKNDEPPLSAHDTEEDERKHLYDEVLTLWQDWQEWKGKTKQQKNNEKKKTAGLVAAGMLTQQISIGNTARAMLQEMQQGKGTKPAKPNKNKGVQKPAYSDTSKSRTLQMGLQVCVFFLHTFMRACSLTYLFAHIQPVCDVFTKALEAESAHRANMMIHLQNESNMRKDMIQHMQNELSFRQDQAKISNKNDQLLVLIAAGIPFAQAQTYVSKNNE